MNFSELLSIVADEPVFSSGFLMAGQESFRGVHLQLSRWTKAARLIQLRRGLYILAKPWRKIEPHPFLIANRMQRGSYVSLQSALAWYGMIPENVPVITSVGPGRPETIVTPLGIFRFRNISENLRFEYRRIEVTATQYAYIALPEKALLDLIHLTPKADSLAYLLELRLQNLSAMDPDRLLDMARRSEKPKLVRAARISVELIQNDIDGEMLL